MAEVGRLGPKVGICSLRIRDGSLISNMVTTVCVKFNYDRLCIDKALENFRKSDNKKNNVRSAWGYFAGPTNRFSVK